MCNNGNIGIENHAETSRFYRLFIKYGRTSVLLQHIMNIFYFQFSHIGEKFVVSLVSEVLRFTICLKATHSFSIHAIE